MRPGRSGAAETGAETGGDGPADGVRGGDGHRQRRRDPVVLHVVRVHQNGQSGVRDGRPGRVRPLPARRPQVPVQPAVHVRQTAVRVRRAGRLRVRGPARRPRARPAGTAPGRHRVRAGGRHRRAAAAGRTAGGRRRLSGVRETPAAPVAGVWVLETRGGRAGQEAGGRGVVSGRRPGGAGAVGHGVLGRGHGHDDRHFRSRP